MSNESREIERRQPTTPAERIEENQPTLTPPTDIFERADSLVIMADMPGVDEKNVDLNIDRNILTVHGRCTCDAPQGHECTYGEYSCGGVYERSFTLSGDLDTQKIDADMQDGVLKIVLPKAEQAKPRKIEVKSG